MTITVYRRKVNEAVYAWKNAAKLNKNSYVHGNASTVKVGF